MSIHDIINIFHTILPIMFTVISHFSNKDVTIGKNWQKHIFVGVLTFYFTIMATALVVAALYIIKAFWS